MLEFTESWKLEKDHRKRNVMKKEIRKKVGKGQGSRVEFKSEMRKDWKDSRCEGEKRQMWGHKRGRKRRRPKVQW